VWESSLGVYPDRVLGFVGQTRGQVKEIRVACQVLGGVVVEFKVASLVGGPFAIFRSPVVVGAWITTAVTVMGVGYAVLMPKPSQSQQVTNEKRSIVELAKLGYCQTIATDPNPPLNVRSSPVSAPDNIVGNLKNGSELTVINENKGWLQISAPLRGWVYEPLTVTTCNPDQKTSSQFPTPYVPIALDAGSKTVQQVAEPKFSQPTMMPGDTLVSAAQEKFHNGDLTGAISNLRQVPIDDLSHEQATTLLKTMPDQWAAAANLYHQAESALQNDRPRVVLEIVEKLPDIRYWRSKITPLVKLAIAQKN
jgi:Bacterial SH3 domain